MTMSHRLTVLMLLAAFPWAVGLGCNAPAAPANAQAEASDVRSEFDGAMLGGVGVLGDLPTLKPGRTRRTTSANPDWRQGQDDWTSVQPGQTLTIADLAGPGVITHIWNTINSQEPGHPRLLRLRIYWDGESEPSVDAPIGDFFAGAHGMNVPVESATVRVTANGRARNCYWPMPFRESARITLTNEGRRGAAVYYNVHWQSLPSLPADAAYFHAEYRQAFPTSAGENYLVADIAGRGHYVGTVLGVYALSRAWWGEGDDLFFIDGESEPSLRGTGTEDYFNDAWGFVQQTGLYYGTPVWEGLQEPPTRTVAYRWHLPDPITFETALRFELEHRGVVFREDGSIAGHTGERFDDFSSVAFWYQVEPHQPFPAMPRGYARLGFDPDRTLEAEALIAAATATAGEVTSEPHTHRGGRGVEEVRGTVLAWNPEEAGETLTLKLALDDGPVTGLTLSVRRSPDGGQYDLTLDGTPTGTTIDFHASGEQIGMVQVELPDLPPREHTLEFVHSGRNPQATSNALALDAVLIRTRPRK